MADARFAVIMPAAGRSSRFRDRDKKPFASLDGRAVWLRSAELFVTRADVCQTIMVVATDDLELVRRRYAANLAFMNIQLAEGGAERSDSIANALSLLKPEAEWVAIHDAVRPCLSEELIDSVFAAAVQFGAALLALPVSETLKQVDASQIVQATLPRAGLWVAQTPQVFRRDWLLEAYKKRSSLAVSVTDDAQLLEAAGHPVHVVESKTTNIKLTTKADLALAEAILKSRPRPKPSGPAHPFAEEDMWGPRPTK